MIGWILISVVPTKDDDDDTKILRTHKGKSKRKTHHRDLLRSYGKIKQ